MVSSNVTRGSEYALLQMHIVVFASRERRSGDTQRAAPLLSAQELGYCTVVSPAGRLSFARPAPDRCCHSELAARRIPATVCRHCEGVDARGNLSECYKGRFARSE